MAKKCWFSCWIMHGSQLSFDLWMTLKRKNYILNVIRVPKLIENEVLYYILKLLCRKLQIQAGQWRPFWILAAILDSGVGIKNIHIINWYLYTCRHLCKFCCFYPKMQDCCDISSYDATLLTRWPTVYDAGPTSAQHWPNASCLLGGNYRLYCE